MTYDADALQRVIDTVVAPNAADIDSKGTFPRASIDALAEAGFLGLTTATEVGGGGGGLRDAAEVIESLAGACGSTAMVLLMHYAANAVLEVHGPRVAREEIATGSHLTTLAFSEAGSRSHFWAPMGTATADGDAVQLDARKSWVTAAADASSYVWSSKPLAADGPMTMWFVRAGVEGLSDPGPFDGMGLRGNGSAPISANGVVVERDAMIGDDGAGLDLALAAVLPWFLVLSGVFSLGLMEAVTAETGGHLSSTRLEHLDQSLVQQPVIRLDYARMRVKTDTVRTFVGDALTAIETSRADAVLRVLEVKALAAETSLEVTDLAMKVCGGAAFRKELGIERRFRDARAARVMAPTTDALLDFVGRAISGLELLGALMAAHLDTDDTLIMGAVAYDPKVVTIWEGFRRWFAENDFAIDFVLYSNYERQVTDLLAGRIHAAWNSPLAWVRARRMAEAEGVAVSALAMRDTDQDLTSVLVVRSDSDIRDVSDLKGRTIGTGAIDSPQATLLTLDHLRQSGVSLDDITVQRFDIGVGLHGDHIGGERDAAKALIAGEVDATCMIDGNHLLFAREGTIPSGTTRVLTQTGLYDHCNMTVTESAPQPLVARFGELLFAMDYGDPVVRPLLDMEGLKEWKAGRTSGYDALEQAVDALNFYDEGSDHR